MSKVILFFILTFISTLNATWQECDVIWIGEKSYRTPVYPLENCTDYNSGGKTFTSGDSGNTRGYVAVWEVKEEKLFLIFIAKNETSMELESFRHAIEQDWWKRSLSHQWATVEGLFPKRAKEGRVFADWFSGTIISPGNAWNKTLSPEEHRNLEAKAKLIVTVKKGIVTKIEHREKQKLQPAGAINSEAAASPR